MGLLIPAERPFKALCPSVFCIRTMHHNRTGESISMISDIEQCYEKSIKHLYFYYHIILTPILHTDLLSFLLAWAFASLLCTCKFSSFLCACAVLITLCVPIWKLGKCSLLHLKSVKPKFKSATPDFLCFALILDRMPCDWTCASIVVMLLRYRENTNYLLTSKYTVVTLCAIF